MTNKKDTTNSKEWDEALGSEDSLAFLTAKKEELLKKMAGGELLPMDAPAPDKE